MKATILPIALCVLALPAAADPETAAALAGVTPNLDAPMVERGRGVYERFCVSCHGERGDGRGISAQWITPRPRDFTKGVFKFRSTPSGSLPTSQDLVDTLRRGVHHTNMPSWAVIGDRNLRAVVEYIKTFSPRWRTDPPAQPLMVPAETADDETSRARGKEVYANTGCFNCHGVNGHGDGPSAFELRDDWGEKILPFDFTDGARLKNGDTPQDMYRTLITGLNGTPMPSFAENLTPQDGWALVHYLRTLRSAATVVQK